MNHIAATYAGWDPTTPPPTHREFARRTKLPGGPLAGTAYDPATDPVQSYVVDQMDAGIWESIAWAAPPQIAGKTTVCIVVPSLRAALELRTSVAYCLPTLSDLDRGWATKVAPMFRDAGFGEYLPKKGPGSKHGRPPTITFEDPAANRAPLGGMVFLAGKARQVTAQVVCIDEGDAWRDADGSPRWSDIEDVWARADSFQSAAIRIITGTIEVDDTAKSIMLPLIGERGTGTRMHQKCRHCGTYAPAEFDAFTYEYRVADGGPDLAHAQATAAYVCPACGVRWSEDDRRYALLGAVFAHKGQKVDAGGKVVGAPPSTRHFGLRTHALDCILTTMAAVADKHAAARYTLEQHGNHEPMRKFYRYQRVEGYHGDKANEDSDIKCHDARSLSVRSQRGFSHVVANRDESGYFARYRADTQPDGIVHRVISVDVQHTRIYWVAIGITADRRTYDLAWGTEYGTPSLSDEKPEPWRTGGLAATLQRVADIADQLAGGPVSVGTVDASDGETQDDVLQFISANRTVWKALRGHQGLPKPSDSVRHLTPMLAWDNSWRSVGCYIVDTDTASQSVAAAYLIDPAAAGAAVMPGPLKSNDAYIQHMTSTVWVTGKDNKPKWKKIRERNDFLDCRAYATATLLHLLVKPPPAPIEKIDIPILHLGGLAL